jgi:hypothetical protein
LTPRNALVVGAIVLAVVAIAGFMYLRQLGSCIDGGAGNASCPALAEVNGISYGVSGPVNLEGIEENLSFYAPIGRSNVGTALSEMTAFSITGVDPLVLLIARSAPDEPGGPYRELWSVADDPFPSALCAYVPPGGAGRYPECP